MLLTVLTLTNDRAIFVHDGSEAFAASLKKRYPLLRVLNGPGAGATAAAKLGIEAARGDFVFWLNSDDKLLPGSVARFVDRASREPNVRIWTGGTRIVSVGGNDLRRIGRIVEESELIALNIANILDDLTLLTGRLCQRSSFAEIRSVDPDFS